MQIKINFDSLFGEQGDVQETRSNFSIPSKYTAEISSHKHTSNALSSLQQSFQCKYNFDPHIFDLDHQEDAEILVDEDLSQQKNESNFYDNKISFPGQRLYYESQQALHKKNKQRQRIKQQKQIQLKNITFAPKINQKSRKIAEKIKTQPQDQTKKHKKIIQPTSVKKQQQQLKECTFQPQIISKRNPLKQTKSKQQLFYNLYSTARIKQIKRNKKIQQIQETQKKIAKKTDGNFDQFLKRNDQYSQLVKKKHQLLKQSSEQYDLKTGQKLFKPKIPENKCYSPHFTTQISSNLYSKPKNPAKINQNIKKPIKYKNEKQPKYDSNYLIKQNWDSKDMAIAQQQQLQGQANNPFQLSELGKYLGNSWQQKGEMASILDKLMQNKNNYEQ